MKTFHRLFLIPALALAAACTDTTAPLAVTAPDDAQLARGAVNQTKSAPSPTIVDVAISVNQETGEFSTLIAAVLYADVATELSARGQRTVFAPTDAAFAGAGITADNVTTLDRNFVKGVLLYHIAPGNRDASSVVGSDRIRMANGKFTYITVKDGGAYINNAMIVATDVPASNGIIHVIDGVLLP
jgi:uncharacterized surface protein with fasciclin (FAS1) repeats